MMHFIASLQARLTEEKGATMVEYGILVSLISIAAITAIVLIGPQLLGIFNEVSAEL